MATNKQQLQLNNETLGSILSNVLGLPSQESLKHGAYVWKKYKDHVPATTLSFTQLTSGIAPMLVQVSSSDPNVDLSKVDGSFFVGLKTKTSSSSTNIITFISENQISLGAEGATSPSVFDYTYNPETAQLSFTTIKWTSVTWDPCTRTEEKGTFVDFVVSDDPTAYPDGGEQGGYWYEKVVEGVTGIDFGEVTISSNSVTSITVAHNLGVVPSWVALVPKVFSRISDTTNENVNGIALYHSRYGDTAFSTRTNTLTATEITFLADSSSYKFAAIDYYWFAIA